MSPRTAVLVMTISSSAFAGVVNSKHDLSGGGTYFNGQVCVYCHTPHNAAESSEGITPLWNRALPSETFAMYASPFLAGKIDAQPNLSSKLCLSCHDGFTAMPYADLGIDWNNQRKADMACSLCHSGGVTVSQIINKPGGLEGSSIPGHSFTKPSHAILGSDLSNDHPISIAYTDASALASSGMLASPSTAASGLGGTIQHDMLRNDKVECISCHDPHSNTFAPFLVMSNDGSGLCRKCHTL